MNWIERMYDLKGKDLYSQNGEGYYLEYLHSVLMPKLFMGILDFGGGDGFHLSNSRHLKNLGFDTRIYDREQGQEITLDNCTFISNTYPYIISIDLDGNDYWILESLIKQYFHTPIIIAEFNPSFTDSRAIKYNIDHVWDGTDYYGFSFDAGVKLAEANGYKVIFQIANMNMIMVREDLINVSIPPVTFQQNNFFEKSNRPDSDWVFI